MKEVRYPQMDVRSEEYTKWIKGLKTGDEVWASAVNGRHYFVPTIRTVTRITPTGRIRLNNDRVFAPNGLVMGPGREYIFPVTPEFLLEVNRQNALRYIEKYPYYQSLSNDDLIAIMSILRKYDEEIKDTEDE